jgi:ribonuclease Z
LYGPQGLKEIIKLQLRLSNSWTNYGLHFHELESNKEVIYEDDKVTVKTIPLKLGYILMVFYFKKDKEN